MSTTRQDLAIDPPLAPETLAVHPWATATGRPRAHRTLNAPLHLSTQWEGADLPQLAELFARDQDRGFYTRFGHPTIRLAEERLAVLEGAADALLFSSGMGAISTSLLAVLRAGDHVVAHQSIFAQTIQFLEHLAAAAGVTVDFVNAAEPDQVAAAMGPRTRLLYLETPSNPAIDIVDIEGLAAIARAHGARVFVDSTFAGPMIQHPLSLGADLVLHSASKSLAGHADVLGGGAAGAAPLIADIRRMRVLTGATLDPHAAWLLLRSMQTLPLRVRAQSDTAERVARQLEASLAVSHIRYPFLPSHPGHEVARRQMALGGGMLSFALHGGLASTRRFVDALRWIPLASSLGSVYTTLEVPEELDFAVEEIGERASSFALPPGLVRLSIGVESAADIQRDIQLGLDAVTECAGGLSSSAERE
ncbi:trans-sulfuration enzyme family protein [Longimicrobium terrae]|uniref:Methionine-gamma-lyase n=1 Tax=Longimicrobium terrae TaxID=1639882 RepID=A0A841GR50_9BACT|nr:aminotransferase class I/II-fold pyridoxal phosphate-dependent enzyme [Longimicrobium terrae]MBB4634401.1 methionine-gamma-lyase [Longimicrobium terrae]MBB6068709.1 methionine-gamma-lyase [Longimicrobium terrae]NNC27895.1 aminotransferase class I/II-fold pyridoxal phosphate-dependent enzyme [Longimicrobium terrae]